MLTEFIIPIVGLKIGVHKYSWKVNGKFFKEFDNEELQEGEVRVNLNLIKESSLMKLSFLVEGFVHSLCDRCGDDLNLSLHHKEFRIVKFSQDDLSDIVDIIVLGNEEYEIDVSHMIYESIVLALPIRRFHSKDLNGQECNSEVIKRLNSFHEQENFNIDSRWSALKHLIKDKEK